MEWVGNGRAWVRMGLGENVLHCLETREIPRQQQPRNGNIFALIYFATPHLAISWNSLSGPWAWELACGFPGSWPNWIWHSYANTHTAWMHFSSFIAAYLCWVFKGSGGIFEPHFHGFVSKCQFNSADSGIVHGFAVIKLAASKLISNVNSFGSNIWTWSLSFEHFKENFFKCSKRLCSFCGIQGHSI